MREGMRRLGAPSQTRFPRAISVLTFACLLVVTACDEKKPAPPPATSSAPAPSASEAPAATASAAPSAAPTAEPTAVSAQHVLVAFKGAEGAPKTVSRTKAEAKKRAEEVLEKAKAGTSFEELVGTYSDDPGSKERRGSVGRFTRDKMVKPFSDAAFALPVDGVSGPVETKYGFHVIKRNQ